MKPLPGILMLLLLTAAPAAGGQKDVLGMPAYPSTESVKYEGRMRTNDVPLDAVVSTTSDDFDSVMDWFKKQVRARGELGVWHQHSPASGYVGYFDPDAGTMRLVTVLTLPNGRTMLVYSNMNPRPLVETPLDHIPEGLPAPEGATRVVSTESRQGQGRHRTISFTLPDTTPAQARLSLGKAAVERGWAVADPDAEHTPAQLLFRRRRSRCMVQIRKKREGTRINMVVIEPTVKEP